MKSLYECFKKFFENKKSNLQKEVEIKTLQIANLEKKIVMMEEKWKTWIKHTNNHIQKLQLKIIQLENEKIKKKY